MKRRSLFIFLIGILALGLIACDNKANDSSDVNTRVQNQDKADSENTIDSDLSPTPEPTPEPIPEPDPFDDTIWEGRTNEYKDMIENSLITTGNNYRIKKAIEKAKNGEELTIAYIGGSITEGYNSSDAKKAYTHLSYQYFKDNYGSKDKDKIKYVNAGMAGTPSTLGMIRYDRDILGPSEGAPDILFIEFAVNDGDDPTNGDAFESLVLNALQDDNQPAIVLVFAVFQSKWNLQDRLMPIGYQYDLPMISIKDAVVPELNEERLTDAEFFSDAYHPTDYGHEIMGDCIKYYFSTVNSQLIAEADITIPTEPAIGNSFVGVKQLDTSSVPEDIIINPGAFSETDGIIGTFGSSPSRKTFPDNWKRSSTSGGESFKMTLDCKNLLLVYKSSSLPSFGNADVYIDGELVRTISSNNGGGWNNPFTILLLNEDKSAKHDIEIKMAEGHEDKEFSILTFGYTN